MPMSPRLVEAVVLAAMVRLRVPVAVLVVMPLVQPQHLTAVRFPVAAMLLQGIPVLPVEPVAIVMPIPAVGPVALPRAVLLLRVPMLLIPAPG